MKISVIAPVLNEIDFIGYSIMACLEQAHEFIYAVDEKSNDGTRDLLHYLKDTYAHEKLVILEHPTFHPLEVAKYNAAYNRCIEQSTGDACYFLHPDMIVTDWPADVPETPLAYWTTVTSYAQDFETVIIKGRTNRWKNIHKKAFGLHYYGGYGSDNEDFYHSDITGKSYKHHGDNFSKYPFEVADSGIKVNHYCELKGYARRLEKMKLCLRTQHPQADEAWIEEKAIHHPRVTLESSSTRFGVFEFVKTEANVPAVFARYRSEFDQFKQERVASV